MTPKYNKEYKVWSWETYHKKGESYLSADMQEYDDGHGFFPKCEYGPHTLEIDVVTGDNDMSSPTPTPTPTPGEVP
jgi:hypothetical protein